MEIKVEGIQICSNEDIDAKSAYPYINYIRSNNPSRGIDFIDLNFENDDVNLSYRLRPIRFEKIRRITGYLVGTMDNWNNAKAQEESHRVKHSTNR